MNNTFSLQRFGLLLKRQWLEFGKIYLISLAVVLGVLLCFYGYNYYAITTFGNIGGSGGLDFRIPLFFILGLLFITIIANNYFAHMGQKSRAIIDLLIPASTFEKFVGSILFTSVLGILGYLLLFYLTDLAFVAKLHMWFEGSKTSVSENGSEVVVNNVLPYFFEQGRERMPTAIFATPFLITSIFLLGSIYFNKYHYIKTALVIMIFSSIWSAIIGKSAKLIFDGRVNMGNTNQGGGPEDIALFWIAILVIALTLIFWAITYVRLKEKEV